MKQRSTIFLQAVIILIGIGTIALLIVFPRTEGRAKNLDLFHIYADPLIVYGYAASIAFFIALYKTFRLLGYIGKKKVFSSGSESALRSIKHCGIAMSILIVIAGIYIRIFHAKDDDPAGFLAMCILATFVSVVIATAAAVFETIVQHGVDIQSENERLKK